MPRLGGRGDGGGAEVAAERKKKYERLKLDHRSARCTLSMRDAMHESSRLPILEKVMRSKDDQVPIGLVARDLHMMVVLGGRERTLDEYDA